MSKLYARSHEITNKPCTSLYYKQTTVYNAEKRASNVKKMKNRRKQNFEGEANNMQLDKEDIRRINLNGKCVFNILILLFVFIMFNKLTCQGSKFIFGFGSTCATRCKFLGALPKF